MIIYRNIFNDDDLFSDSFPIKLSECGFYYEIEGKLTSISHKLPTAIISGNISAQDTGDDFENENVEVESIDVMESFKYTLMKDFTVERYTDLMKKFVGIYLGILEKDGDAEKVRMFKEDAAKFVTAMKDRFKDFRVYVGENGPYEDTLPILMDHREDGVTPYFVIPKLFVKEEKY